jgi:hypothetical protein
VKEVAISLGRQSLICGPYFKPTEKEKVVNLGMVVSSLWTILLTNRKRENASPEKEKLAFFVFPGHKITE